MEVDQLQLLCRNENIEQTKKVLWKDFNNEQAYAFYLVQCGHTITWTDHIQQIQATYKQSLETPFNLASKPAWTTVVSRVRERVRSVSNTRSKKR